MIINTATDLQAACTSPEQQAFLANLYNDFITFDDAEYPEGYDYGLTPEDEGYVEPVLRQEWNAGAAAGWGFTSRQQVEDAIAAAISAALQAEENEIIPPQFNADGTVYVAPEPEPPIEDSDTTQTTEVAS